MKKLLKKNQIIITALLIMIAVAGYLNYSQSVVNDMKDKESEVAQTDESIETLSEQSEEDALALSENEIFTAEEEDEYEISEETTATEDFEVADSGELVAKSEETEVGEAVLVSNTIEQDYFTSAKLEREQNRAKSKEILMELVNDENVTKAQKQEALDEILAMTKIAEKENATELMLESKGFSDVVVSMSEGSVDVIVNVSELTTPQMAQIEDIVKRKTGADASEIIINPVVKEP